MKGFYIMATTSYKTYCTVCNGYGLYKTKYTKDGSALHCNTCNGSGIITITVEVFTERKSSEDVSRVFLTNCGVTIQDYPNMSIEDQGGVSYEEWAEHGKGIFIVGTEIQSKTCPKMWYSKLNSEDVSSPEWEECVDENTLYRRCPNWKTKDSCWTKFIDENPSS